MLVPFLLTAEKPWIPNRLISQLSVHNVFMIKLPIIQYSTIWLHLSPAPIFSLSLLLAIHDQIQQLFSFQLCAFAGISSSAGSFLSAFLMWQPCTSFKAESFETTSPQGLLDLKLGKISFLLWWENTLHVPFLQINIFYSRCYGSLMLPTDFKHWVATPWHLSPASGLLAYTVSSKNFLLDLHCTVKATEGTDTLSYITLAV